MHRQIAGKLTGPVTKWIVLVAIVLLDRRALARSAAKLADVKNNEAVLLAPGVRRVDQGGSTSCPGRSTPTTSRHWSSTTAPPV